MTQSHESAIAEAAKDCLAEITSSESPDKWSYAVIHRHMRALVQQVAQPQFIEEWLKIANALGTPDDFTLLQWCEELKARAGGSIPSALERLALIDAQVAPAVEAKPSVGVNECKHGISLNIPCFDCDDEPREYTPASPQPAPEPQGDTLIEVFQCNNCGRHATWQMRYKSTSSAYLVCEQCKLGMTHDPTTQDWRKIESSRVLSADTLEPSRGEHDAAGSKARDTSSEPIFQLRERADGDGWTLLRDGVAVAGGSINTCIAALQNLAPTPLAPESPTAAPSPDLTEAAREAASKIAENVWRVDKFKAERDTESAIVALLSTQRAKDAETIQTLTNQLEQANAGIAYIADTLDQWPCCHDAGEHSATPLMMWPELIACIVKKAVQDSTADLTREVESLREDKAMLDTLKLMGGQLTARCGERTEPNFGCYWELVLGDDEYKGETPREAIRAAMSARATKEVE